MAMPGAADNADRATVSRGVLVRGFVIVSWTLAIGLVLSVIAARLAGGGSLTVSFLALMVQTFAFHSGLVVAGLLLVALAIRRWRLGAALLLATLASVGPLGVSAMRPDLAPIDDDATLTVLSCNTRYGTSDPDLLLAWIDEVDPDVIALQEYAEPWPAIMESRLAERYPHAWQKPGGAHGQAIFTRLEFEELVPDVLGWRWKMTAPRVTIEHQGRRIDLTNVHVYPPMRLDLMSAQLEQLGVLEESVIDRKGRVDGLVLAGDFNSPWNTNHLRGLRDLGLREAHAEVGRGRGATWGPTAGVLSLVPGIRIDHAIYGGELEAVFSAVGPDVGSDHRPIAVGFRWR